MACYSLVQGIPLIWSKFRYGQIEEYYIKDYFLYEEELAL
jgi:hypothetical protein